MSSTALVEELEIINSIYEGSASYEQSTSSLSLLVPDSRVRLRLFVPAQYPEDAPRVLSVSGTADDNKAAAELNDLVKYTFTPGEVFLFTFLDELKPIIESLEPPEDDVEQTEPTEAPQSLTSNRWVVTGEIHDRKSVFVGRAIAASSEEEVSDLISDILNDKKVAKASHNMFAWRIKIDAAGLQFAQDFDEDGEGGAGPSMLHVLQMSNAQNVVVLVSRYFFGVHIGPDRFKHIKNCTKEALVKGSFINK